MGCACPFLHQTMRVVILIVRFFDVIMRKRRGDVSDFPGDVARLGAGAEASRCSGADLSAGDQAESSGGGGDAGVGGVT